ncbi:MAG: response regulator [Bacteroidota bacterium]
MRNNKPILLIEDDEVDAMTVKRALKDIKVTNPLVRALNGEEALDYLHNSENQRPCLMLLDLNMPKMNGIEFLKERYEVVDLKTIPVVVLTTSKDDQDKLDSFRLDISGYMIKPVDYGQFVETMKVINMYFTLSESVDQS